MLVTGIVSRYQSHDLRHKKCSMRKGAYQSMHADQTVHLHEERVGSVAETSTRGRMVAGSKLTRTQHCVLQQDTDN